VKNDDDVRNNVGTPIEPILLNGGLAMVAVEEEKIDGAGPLVDGVRAEVFYPDDMGARVRRKGATCRATEEIESAHSGKMKRVREIQHAMGIHGGAEGHGGGSLGDADFDKTGAAASEVLQSLMFSESALCDGRAKSGPSEERVIQGGRLPGGRVV
jgi:hypothetical protein